MKKIGIFIGYAPEQPIKNQGIGRLMIFIINGIMDLKNTQICIAAPCWYKETLIDFLEEHDIDLNKIEILTTGDLPYLLRIRNFLSAREKRKTAKAAQVAAQPSNGVRLKSQLKKHLKTSVKIIFRWLSLSSTPKFIFYGFLLCLAGLILSPVIFILACVFVLRKIIKAPHRLIPGGQHGFIYRKISALKNKLSRYLTGSLSSLKNNAFAHMAYAEMRALEFKKMIGLINQRNDIPVWFVPSLFWPEVKDIQAKKVVAAPDIVFVDFPSLFQDLSFILSHEIITKTLSVADHFICYSDYVKQKHLVEPFGVEPNKVSVIEHGVILLDEELRSNKHNNFMTLRDLSLEALQEYQARTTNNPYLNRIDFTTANFLFYSSQIRPHKNFLNLIKAYEILLRERFVNIKLIVTANLYDNPEVAKYLNERRLNHDVIALTHVPSKVLAALNHLAVCAVNPTLFEGGFPFTFNEAYSVGTPSVMSKIPVVTQHVQAPQLQERMLFDPYDIDDMVNKMQWAAEHRDELLALQKPLYQQFEQRTWDVVASEYINLLNQIAAHAA